MVQDPRIDMQINSPMSDEWHESSLEKNATNLKVDFVKNCT